FNGNSQFAVNDVIEGDYQVALSDLAAGTYIKSIRFGAADVLNGSLHIDPGANDRIEIVLAGNAGVVDGTVLDKNREPVPHAPVALVPDAAHRQRGDLYRNTITDEFGKFHLQGIAPGDYSLFAWEDIEEGLWRDSDLIRRYEASGKAIRILEGSH